MPDRDLIGSSRSLPSLVVSDSKGNLFDTPEYGMAVRSGPVFALPGPREVIALPEGSDLHLLPDRHPVGIDRSTGKFTTIKTYRGVRVIAASAFVAPAYTALRHAAFLRKPGSGTLPLFAYAPLGFDGTGFVTTALRIDKDVRQDAGNFDQKEILKRGAALLKKFSGNRLTEHLVKNCAFTYRCPAGRNWVMGRWEAPIPTSVACNSSCLGCISKQPSGSGVPATQPRIAFVPTAEEIVAYTVPHLQRAPRAVVSFGQGCEGEPLLQAELIAESVREMRKRTRRGTINLNTNGSLPRAVELICKAGLDSIRVSLNSAREGQYAAYYRPRGYEFSDVIESLRIAKGLGVWVSLNYFIFPGFTDTPAEMEALGGLLSEIPIDMIQMRNHNVDPDWYAGRLGIKEADGPPAGIAAWMGKMKSFRPSLVYGYFNPPISRR